MSDDNHKTSEQNQKITRLFNLRISDSQFNRLDSHITLSNRMQGAKRTRRKWIEEAIQEKLDREKSIPMSQIAKERRLTFEVNPELDAAIEERVKRLKRIHTSYSKKKWIYEAVDEKIQREECAVQQWLENPPVSDAK